MSVSAQMTYPLTTSRIKVTKEQIRRQRETMLNRPVRKRITFARSMNLSARASRDWFGLVRLLAREAGQADGILAHRLAIDNLHLSVQGLLLIQPHNCAEALAEDEARASTAVAVSESGNGDIR
jgi:hypothetical protein